MVEDRLKRLWEFGPMFVEGTPHGAMLGIKFVAIDIDRATLSLPYDKKLVGNKETGVLHGGVLTTLLDQACGLAAIASFKEMMAVATLDLRIDYMRAAEPGKTIIAEAHAYKTTKHIAFVRGIAHEGDVNDPVATSQASFMTTAMGRKSPKKGDRQKAIQELPKPASNPEGQKA
ncbi:MAG: PaaI family thioesterase [Acidimicrobiales bacterium]|nr:PaaI family thioesterase [Hyphomonadaceae bacterium]RZV44169.1 MAG: PaaI family thioesterase [Acidimicrobiales bacterium]